MHRRPKTASSSLDEGLDDLFVSTTSNSPLEMDLLLNSWMQTIPPSCFQQRFQICRMRVDVIPLKK
ncbi:hypothetical protein Ciccas_000418 [Cichlidogyrus casuarinus]|uniref:Uncharacterized protein n=1 Tax=Cichlidogyrus casuarinus TaxID=1844966 RepID=A0ABD2QNB8_9PLAT